MPPLATLKKRPKGGPPRERTPDELPPGGFSFGTSWLGGPLAMDPFGARPAPSPYDLIEKYKSLVFMMAARNRHAVMRVPLRLMCDGSRRILGGRPRAACDPIQVPRSAAERLVRAGLASSGAVDQIYEVRNHPVLDALERPDPYGCLTKRQLIGLMVTYNDIVGHSFLVPDGLAPKAKGTPWDYRTGRIGTGPPEHLWVTFPQYSVPYFDGRSPIPLYWQYFADRLPFESVLWFRQSLSLRNPYGASYSATYAGSQYAESEDRFIAVLDQQLGFSPIPAVVLSAKDPLNPPGDIERRRMEQDFMRRNSFGNASRIFVNNGAYDFNVINRPPTDLGAKEMSEYDLYRLASIFDQPPTFYTVDTNLANLEAAREQHATDGVEPRCWMVAETLTNFVRRFDPRLFFAFDPVSAEDDLKRAQVDKIYVDMGARTINQVNEERKYPAVEYGDLPYVNKNLIRIDLLDEQARQSIENNKARAEDDRKMLEFQTAPEAEAEGGPDAESAAEQERSLAAQRHLWSLLSLADAPL